MYAPRNHEEFNMPKIRTKHSRRFGQNLKETEDKYFHRKPYPPGQHGKSRRRVSEYGKQLSEKQKLKVIYGLRERQFRNYFDKAALSGQKTGQELMSLLERRLDNVIYRLGIATTRAQARQIVSHGHVTVNGRKVTVPSFQVSISDEIALKDRSKGKGMFKELEVRTKKYEPPVWLSLDKSSFKASVSRLPDADSTMDVPVEIAQIVEFYSR